jgi:hypothetical protein
MKLTETQRIPLANWPDVLAANEKLRDRVTTTPTPPRDAVVLDEDCNDREFIRGLREQQVAYADGQPGLTKYPRLEVIAAGHIFQSTNDWPLLSWCRLNDYPLITANVEDFVGLHQQGFDHSGILVISDRVAFGAKPDAYAEEVARIFGTLRKSELRDEVVEVTLDSD